jgi:hypothetical protein
MVTKKKMTLHLRIWRQPNSHTPGKFVTYTVRDVSPDMSLLELLDVLNEQLIKSGELPVESHGVSAVSARLQRRRDDHA